MSNNSLLSVDREQREDRELTGINNAISNSHMTQTYGSNSVQNQGHNLIAESSNTIPERPCYISHDSTFVLDTKEMKPGLYYHAISAKGELIDQWVSLPITVVAVTSSTENTFYGRLIEFLDINNQMHEYAMPMIMLKGNGDELISALLEQGFVFERRFRDLLLNYIMHSKPSRNMLAVSTIGWHNNVFVLPNRIIGDTNIVFQSPYYVDHDFSSKGTLADWQEIARLCIDNVPLIISISSALAATILKFIDVEHGAGIHWYGDSSTGKSTTIEVAGSIWGSSSFIRSWSTTANGFEGLATTRNDTCLILDEIDRASPIEIGNICYMMENGQGKQRATINGTSKRIQRWRTMTLSTGERSLTNIMMEVQKQPNSGQLVRLLNINCKFEYGVFSNLHGFTDGRILSNYLKSAAQKSYGTLGPAFIEKLQFDKQDLYVLFTSICGTFSQYANNNIQNRAASIFASIALAGELAIQYKLLPWAPNTAIDASLIAFNRWKDSDETGCTEDEQILECIRIFIDKYGDSRFTLLSQHGDDRTHNRAGWIKIDNGRRIYMFQSYALVEAVNKFSRRRIVEALKNASWIADHDQGRQTKKTSILGEYKNLYYICIKDITRDES